MQFFFRNAFFLFATCAVLSTTAQTHHTMKQLKKDILDTLSGQDGTFAVAFQDVATGKKMLINDKEFFHAASTMKTPVMIEVYKQAAAGRFSLGDSILIKNEFSSIVDSSAYSLDPADDSQTEIYQHVGEKRTLYDLMYQMIIASSNLSTNLIIEKVGAKNVTATMRAMGARKIRVLRGVEDNKAYEKGLNNMTTAHDLMVIFDKIALGEAVSKEASDEMIRILLNQKYNDLIPALLPQEVKVAHKTGSITGVHHDSGIVFLPDGRKYVLVILSKNVTQEKEAIGAIAKVSKMIYDYMTAR